MRRHVRASSIRSKAGKSVGLGRSSSSGRLRLAILLATAAAFLLVPAAQAVAAGTFKLNIAGTGGGEVVSEFGWADNGSPPIECSYASPGPATGTCENTMTTSAGEDNINLLALPGAGSEFGGWTIDKGADGTEISFGVDCNNSEWQEFAEAEFGGPICLVRGEPAEGGAEVTAYFCTEGTAPCEGPTGPELTIAKEGTGTGTVTSNPAGIECGATCSSTAFAEGSKVTLTASPSAGSTFVSWKGCEKGGVNGRQCTVTMDKAKTVNAKFLTAYDVTVNRVGSGLGKVSSSPGGVLCLSNCSSTTAAFKEGTSVTLSAAPTKNYVFTEWTGDCSGSSLTCSLGSLGADKTVGAKFTAVAQHNLTVTKSGGGNGTAKSNVAGINCGATCSSMAAAYYQGTVVELTATPGKGSTFGGWSGSGCSGTGTCTVTMSAAKSVTAEFK